MIGNISDAHTDNLYNNVIDILVALKRKDLADGLNETMDLMDKKSDTNLVKVDSIVDALEAGLPPFDKEE